MYIAIVNMYIICYTVFKCPWIVLEAEHGDYKNQTFSASIGTPPENSPHAPV